MTENNQSGNPFEGAPVICAYTREQAIADGVLVDVTLTAREAGFKFPVAVTEAVWRRYVEYDERSLGQNEDGRLWDVLWMLRLAIAANRGKSLIEYQLHVAIPDGGNWQPNEAPPERGSGLSRSTHRLVTLKAVCGPGDNAEPVVTIMLPSED